MTGYRTGSSVRSERGRRNHKYQAMSAKGQQRWWHGQAECFSRREIDGKLGITREAAGFHVWR
jgi:hypothetical protein